MVSEFNNQPIGVLQNSYSTIRGIFAFLRTLNGGYGTRYTIDSHQISSSYPSLSIDRYYEWTNKYTYQSVEGKLDIKITFDSPFILTGYAVCNGVHLDTGNTYPTGWQIIAINEKTNKEIILDEQKEQKFCASDSVVCATETVKGYGIKRSLKSIQGYKEFIFRQTAIRFGKLSQKLSLLSLLSRPLNF